MTKPIMMTKVECYDKFITNKLAYLLYEDFNKFMYKVNSDERETDENNAKIWEFKEYKKLIKICNQAIKNNYSVKQSYSYAENKEEGRLFLNNPNGGLQNINKYFRGVLCNGIYTDIDMKCCHHNILTGICLDDKIECFYLKEYCMNRKEKLKELIKRGVKKDDAKKLFIISINNSNIIDKYKVNEKKYIEFNENDFFYKFDKEMKEIQNKIFNNIKYKKNKEKIKEEKGLYNIKGRLLNNLLCIIENEIIQQVIKNGFKVDIPMFDGYMTSETIENNKLYLEKLNNIDICKKYNIEWDIKEHNLDLYDDIMKIEKTNKKSYYATDIIDLSNQLLESELKNKIFRYRDQKANIIYYKEKKHWTTHLETIQCDLTKIVTEMNLYLELLKKNGSIEYIRLNKNTKNIKDLIEYIIKLCPVNNEKKDELWNESLFKIVFNNGCYDFKTGKFETDFDKINTFNYISYDLNFKSNPDIRKKIYDIILNPIFSICDEKEDERQVKIRDNYLYRMSRTMAGHIEDKKFYIMSGERDCGKGVLSDLLKKCFKSYVMNIDSSSLLYKKTNGDASKNNSWIVDCEFSRLTMSQEIKLDEKETIDGIIIKKFCSGGDYINGRKNFKDEREFKIQSGLMVCCNDIPKIEPNDTYENTIIYDMKSKFINDDFDEENKLTNIKYFKKIENLKTEYLNNQEIINEFVLIILEHYNKKTEIPEEEKQNILNDFMTDNETKIIKDLFIQSDENDYLTYEELKQIIKDENLTMTITKLNKKIKGCFKVKQSNSHGKKIIKGIKRKLV